MLLDAPPTMGHNLQRAVDEAGILEGMVLVKLWLHISHEEQFRRFEGRQADPLKSWKLADEDWRNREKRVQYELAVQDMLKLTADQKQQLDELQKHVDDKLASARRRSAGRHALTDSEG